ncbi:MAG: hypothetical protein Q8R17_02110 [bacterium]|nr:hypothetical protein [bacterium]
MVLLGFVIPQISFAVWWNPATWFKKSAPVPVVQTKSDSPASPSAKKASTSPTSKSQTLPVKKEDAASKQKTDQSVEIEKLKKEVERLKKQESEPSSTVIQPAAPAAVPVSAPATIKNPIKEEVFDKASIIQFIDTIKTRITQFNNALAESSGFTSKIHANMVEYYNNLSVQQTGRDLLDNNIKRDILMDKLVEYSTALLNKLTPYVESNNVFLKRTELSSFLEEFQSEEHQFYIQEYQTRNEQTGPLLKSFVDTIKIAAQNAQEENNELSRLREQRNRLNAVNQKIATLTEKYVQDIQDNEKSLIGAGVTTIFRDRQQADIYRKYQVAYNALQAEFQQIQYGN